MSRPSTESTSTSAKILYRPVGIVSSVLGGLVANLIFKKVWQRAAPPQAPSDPPNALDTRTDLKTILLAAGLQGAIFAVVKVLDRPRRCPRVPAVERRVARRLTPGTWSRRVRPPSRGSATATQGRGAASAGGATQRFR